MCDKVEFFTESLSNFSAVSGSEKLYLEGGAMWVNKVELLRQYGAMGGNQ